MLLCSGLVSPAAPVEENKVVVVTLLLCRVVVSGTPLRVPSQFRL